MEGIFTDDDLFVKQSVEDAPPACVDPDFVQEDCIPPKKWVPKIRTGFFYNRDRQYYLYDKKASTYLMDLTWTRLRLSDVIDPATAVVKFRGFVVPVSAYRFDGHFIEVNHAGLSHPGTHIEGVHLDVSLLDPFNLGIVFDPSEFITIDGTSKFSVAGSGVFTNISVEQRLPLTAGTIFYEFPVIPNPRAPIVITDDSVQSWDRRQLAPEFNVDYVTGRFHINEHRSLMRNGDFEQDLDFWKINSGTVTIGTGNPGFGEFIEKPAVGNKYAELDSTANFSQEFPVNENGAFTLQFKARALTSAILKVHFIFNFAAGGGSVTFLTPFQLVASADWKDFSMSIGQANQARTPDFVIPPTTTSIEVVISVDAATAEPLEIDAVHFVDERFPVDVFEAHPLSTIEYEVGDGIFYTHHRLIQYDRFGKIQTNHFPQPEIDLNPVTSVIHDGFLYFHESDSISDWQLGLGGSVFDPLGNPVTSFVKGRRHVPYAKLSGPGKFIQTGIFNIHNPKWTEEVVDTVPIPIPAEVSINTFSGTAVIELIGLSLAFALGAKDLEVELSLGHGINVSQGHVKIVDPTTSLEKIVFFVDRVGNTLKLGEPFGFAAPIGTVVKVETRRLRVKENRDIDFTVTVEDTLFNAMDQLEGQLSLTVISGGGGDLIVSTLLHVTNQDGQQSFKATGVVASGIMLFEYTAGNITAELEIEVV